MSEPCRATAPPRPPIELQCGRGTAPRLARSAILWNVRRGGGLLVLGTSGLAGAVAADALHSVLLGAVLAAVVMALLLGIWVVSTTRVFRRMAPAHQLLVSRYDRDGRLALSTGTGTTTLSRGSVDRVVLSSGTVAFRLRQSRQWAHLPVCLLTDEDLAFLAGSGGHILAIGDPAGPSTGSGVQALHAPGTPAAAERRHLPLMHVVTPETQRDLRAAVTRVTWRSPSFVSIALCLPVCVVAAVLVPTPPLFAAAIGVLLLAALSLVGPALALRRQTPVGEIVRAAVTADGLVLELSRIENVWPWATFRAVTATRRAVILVLRSRRVLALPRDLFPGHELVQLQQLVREAQSARPD